MVRGFPLVDDVDDAASVELVELRAGVQRAVLVVVDDGQIAAAGKLADTVSGDVRDAVLACDEALSNLLRRDEVVGH
ncbi:hypothetical protein [Promicromonospora sp. NPDC023805]|uniref:hypothetical protein n=1 Tax=Promicromonospora sp. NPDC023805 TaxID=3154696 RepID=UPI0033FCAF1F